MFSQPKYDDDTPRTQPKALLLTHQRGADAAAVQDVLRRSGYHVLHPDHPAEDIPAKDGSDIEVILVDRQCSEFISQLPYLRQLAPDAFLVIMTEATELGGAVEAVDQGVFDFLFKPVDPEALENTLRRVNQLSEIRLSRDSEAIARQRAEKQNRLLAEALSQMGDCVVVTSGTLAGSGPRIVFVNDAACQTSGYSREQLIGRSPRIFLGHQTDLRQVKQLQQELAAGHSYRGQIVSHRNDGSSYVAELFITPMLDSEQRCTHFVSVHRDISERQQTERALRESEGQIRAILSTAADAIVTIDYHGIVISANPSTFRTFGYAPHELVGENVNILMPEPYHSSHNDYIERFLRTGQAGIIGVGREVVAKRKDGSTFPVSLTISQIEHSGLFTGIIRDISALKQLQKQVLEIAAEEDRRIGQELHDSVQQELTGLGLLAETVSDMLSTSLPEATTADPKWGKIHKMIQRVAQGINQVSHEVHQLSRGLVPVEIDAEGLRWALTELAAGVEERYSIRCRFTSRGDIDLTNNFAATHLFRIVQEAVNNAVKHGHAQQIDISMIGQERSIVLEVLDDGSGISQSQPPTAGLGLRIMPYRASLIGATVSVTPGNQGGTRVRCQIPRGQIENV